MQYLALHVAQMRPLAKPSLYAQAASIDPKDGCCCPVCWHLSVQAQHEDLNARERPGQARKGTLPSHQARRAKRRRALT